MRIVAPLVVSVHELKWRTLRPAPHIFDFTRADAVLDFAQRSGVRFRGHTLVWGGSLPDWFAVTVDESNAERFLTEPISTVLGHYAGVMHSWDVVNEAVGPEDGRADGLRDQPWLRALGPRYIDLAFRAAAEADPRAQLTLRARTQADLERPRRRVRRPAPVSRHPLRTGP